MTAFLNKQEIKAEACTTLIALKRAYCPTHHYEEAIGLPRKFMDIVWVLNSFSLARDVEQMPLKRIIDAIPVNADLLRITYYFTLAFIRKASDEKSLLYTPSQKTFEGEAFQDDNFKAIQAQFLDFMNQKLKIHNTWIEIPEEFLTPLEKKIDSVIIALLRTPDDEEGNLSPDFPKEHEIEKILISVIEKQYTYSV